MTSEPRPGFNLDEGGGGEVGEVEKSGIYRRQTLCVCKSVLDYAYNTVISNSLFADPLRYSQYLTLAVFNNNEILIYILGLFISYNEFRRKYLFRF